MSTDFAKDVIVPILAPIDEEENIDERELREQVDYATEGGIPDILALGSNGKFCVIEEDGMERGSTTVVNQTAGRVPVYFGIGAISMKGYCHLARMVVANGTADTSVLQPMFLKLTESELYLYSKTVVESVPKTPILLYNNPGRVNYTLPANLVDHLAHEVENIVGMKDVSDDITQTSEFIRRTRDVNFKVLGGKGTLLYAFLYHGVVDGVCTAASLIPELVADVYNKFMTEDLNGSSEAQFKLNPVHLSIDGTSFPVAAKDMANLRGHEIGLPYTLSLPTPEGLVLDRIRRKMGLAGLI